MSSPPRPVPRRVYGKSKAQPAVTTTDLVRTTTNISTTTASSDSPALTVRFGKHADWRKTLAEDGLSDDEDEDEDLGDPSGQVNGHANGDDTKQKALRILRAKRETERLKEERERLVLLAQEREKDGEDTEEREAPSSQNNRGGVRGGRRRVGFGYRYGMGKGEGEVDEAGGEEEGSEGDEEEDEEEKDGPVSSSLPPLTSSLPPSSLPQASKSGMKVPTALRPNGLLSTSTSAITPAVMPSSTLTPLTNSGSSARRLSSTHQGSASSSSEPSSPSPNKIRRRRAVIRSDTRSSPTHEDEDGRALGEDPDMDMEETYAPIKAGVRRKGRKRVGLSSFDDEDEDKDGEAGEGDRTITPSRSILHARGGRRRSSSSPPPFQIDFDQIEDEAQSRGIEMDDVLRERRMLRSSRPEIDLDEVDDEAMDRGISMDQVLLERGIDPSFPEDLEGLDGLGHELAMTRTEVEEQRDRWMRMRSEIDDSSDRSVPLLSTPQRTPRDRAKMIAISGLSPTSPSAGRAGSGRSGMGHDEEDVDMDGEVGGSPSVRASRKRQGRVGLSDFGSSEEEVGRLAKAPKIRPLSKKQKIEMEREQAKIRASKPIKLAPSARPRPAHFGGIGGGGLGMTDFVRQTQLAWIPAAGTTALASAKATKPMSEYLHTSGLGKNGVEVRPSVRVPTGAEAGMQEEEEIGKFSSGGNRNPGISTRELGSSPTNKGKGRLRLKEMGGHAGMEIDLDEDDDDDLPDLKDVIAKRDQERLIERKREELARLKAIEYKRLQEEANKRDGEDEDDLIIDGAPDSIKKPPPVKRQNGGSARGIFDHARETRHGNRLDAGQRLAALAGVATNKHQDTMTESLVVHAGRDYDHANKKRAGALPSGLEKRKVEVIPKMRLDAELIQRQKKLDIQERARKELESGIKARRLEDKKPLEMDELIKRGGWDEPEDEVDSDEDPEDGDFKPEGEVDGEQEVEVDDAGSGDERSIVYSGEEDEPEPIVLATPSAEDRVELDDDLETALPRRSRPRKSVIHTVRDSDDEETTPKAPSKTSFVPPSRSTPDLDTTVVDDVNGFGAFGEGDDTGLGGGFSQFFGATQAGDSQADAFGGFDVLRHDDADAVLATQVHLPDPTISATARRRNEELLEGEMMLDEDSIEVEKAPLKQYLNEEGLLTQTRPAGRIPLRKADTATSLQSEGASEHTSNLSVPLSATYRSPPPIDDDERIQGTMLDEVVSFRRLKPRRPSTSLSDLDDPDLPRPGISANTTLDSDPLSATELASDPAPVAQPRQRNAFDLLKAAPRAQLKQDAKSVAERKARFVEGEAEESDEENGWGGGTRQDDIEEDEDPNAILEELVDDAEKTAEELEKEEQQRLQKYREIAEQDDEKNRKVAEDLTKGLYRTGKNGKMNDIEFSDDEDEERKSKRSKKRRRERDIKGVDRESAFNHVHQEIVASSDEEFGEAEDDDPSFSVRMSSPVAADSVPQKTISDKAREFAIENKRSMDLALQDSASDTEGSEDERSTFRLARYDSQSIAPRPSMVSRDSSKFTRHLNEESQRSTDTRKIGGSSSVSGVANRKTAIRSAFGVPVASKTSKILAPMRTQSRSLGRVMDKSGHFDTD